MTRFFSLRFEAKMTAWVKNCLDCRVKICFFCVQNDQIHFHIVLVSISCTLHAKISLSWTKMPHSTVPFVFWNNFMRYFLAALRLTRKYKKFRCVKVQKYKKLFSYGVITLTFSVWKKSRLFFVLRKQSRFFFEFLFSKLQTFIPVDSGIESAWRKKYVGQYFTAHQTLYPLFLSTKKEPTLFSCGEKKSKLSALFCPFLVLQISLVVVDATTWDFSSMKL